MTTPYRPLPSVPMVPAYMKTDAIRVDTSRAPWMDVALAELGKQVRELSDTDSFARTLHLSLVAERSQSGGRPGLLEAVVQQARGDALRSRNAEIVKYFGVIKTDPLRDRKGRSWNVAPVHEDRRGEWQVTAWCAAFVSWCLQQAGTPAQGYATADSWLRFGTPLPTPVYGCITVIPPSRSTGSTTGHVAFYTETSGEFLVLLGGNQGDRVSKMRARANRVLGYRWPTAFNHFLLGLDGAIA